MSVCACFVISWQFRGWGQTEWSGLQGWPLTDSFVCGRGGDSQWPQLLSRQRGEKLSPFKTGEFRAVCSESAFVWMPRLERGDGGGTGGTDRMGGGHTVENMSQRVGKKKEVEEK